MEEKLEKLIAAVYREWREKQRLDASAHPDEELTGLLVDDKLEPPERAAILEHVVRCRQCSERIAVQLRNTGEEQEVPAALIEKVKKSIALEMGNYFLEIMLRVKERMLEIVHTTGDVLVGQEFVPAAVLRGRSISDFKDIRVEIKIESREGSGFDATIVVRDKGTQGLIKDARIILLKDGAELESYVSDPGRVRFEHVPFGMYRIEAVYSGEPSAVIVLEITG
jgi:DNA-directed RNA polymerase subunit RPC12/RpoP